MLVTKSTVRFGGFTKELIEILQALHAASRILKREIVITSGSDGKHMPTSKHYSFEALDVRSKNLSKDEKIKFIDLIKSLLGDKYTIILEDEGTPNEHIHIQVKR